MANEQTLEQRYTQIRKKYCEYGEHTPVPSEYDFLKAGLVWGEDKGNQTPRALLIAMEPGHWEYSREDRLDLLNYELLAGVEGDWPVFAHLEDDKNARCNTGQSPS